MIHVAIQYAFLQIVIQLVYQGVAIMTLEKLILYVKSSIKKDAYSRWRKVEIFQSFREIVTGKGFP